MLLLFLSLSAFAQEPAANPTNLQFNNIKSYGLTLSFTGVQADGYLVLKSDQIITFVPVDHTTYEKGQGVPGGAKVVSGSAAATLYSVREMLEDTRYYFAIYAFNGTGTSIDYKQTNALTGDILTPAADPGSYYVSVDSAAYSFISDLHTLINPHTQSTYTPGYANTILPAMYERDTTGGQAVVNCEYSAATTIYTPPFSFTGTNYTREHVLCKSWMQTYTQYGSNVVQYPEGSDYHNLLLVAGSPNSARNNHPYGVVVNTTNTYGPSKIGKDANNITVFEPGDNRKGDAARAMMYEMICYDGLSGDWGLKQLLSEAADQDQNVLKQWNIMDPPDKFERTKNEFIFSVQSNRNPFIDHPQWANCINFDSLFKTNVCGAVSGIRDEVLDVRVNIYPNPATEYLNVQLFGEQQDFTAEIVDMYGRIILSAPVTGNLVQIGVNQLPSGNYLLKITAGTKSAYHKFLILN
ncbi:MAG: endonuclease [Chitinophagales bacterium]